MKYDDAFKLDDRLGRVGEKVSNLKAMLPFMVSRYSLDRSKMTRIESRVRQKIEDPIDDVWGEIEVRLSGLRF